MILKTEQENREVGRWKSEDGSWKLEVGNNIETY